MSRPRTIQPRTIRQGRFGSRYRTPAGLLAGVLLAGTLAACGSPAPELDRNAATQLQAQVLSVSQAAAAHDPAGSLKLLDGLLTRLDAAAANGEVSFKRHQSIKAAIDAVRADLTAQQAAAAAARAAAEHAAAEKAAAAKAAAEKAAAAQKAQAEAAAAKAAAEQAAAAQAAARPRHRPRHLAGRANRRGKGRAEAPRSSCRTGFRSISGRGREPWPLSRAPPRHHRQPAYYFGGSPLAWRNGFRPVNDKKRQSKE